MMQMLSYGNNGSNTTITILNLIRKRLTWVNCKLRTQLSENSIYKFITSKPQIKEATPKMP